MVGEADVGEAGFEWKREAWLRKRREIGDLGLKGK